MADDKPDVMFDGPLFVWIEDARAALAKWQAAPPSPERDLHLADIKRQIALIEKAEKTDRADAAGQG